MQDKPDNRYRSLFDKEGQKLSLLWKSAFIGVLVGTVVVAYRIALTGAEEIAFAGYAYVRAHPALIPLLILFLAALGYGIGALVSKYPFISGSGIPQVKGIMMGYFKVGWLSTLIAKFVGGTLAILGGLSLGREGPSVQLGASIAQELGKKISLTRSERKILIASGAGAGLAAAFNAPLAGVMFTMEEIFKYISPVTLLSTMVSAIAADCISRVVFGAAPVFSFQIQSGIPLQNYWIVCLLGIVLGCAGAGYNWVLIAAQKLYRKIAPNHTACRMVIPFLFAAAAGLLLPSVLCGGHALIEELVPSAGLMFLVILLLAKFVFSMISFGAGAPGGIFFPLLVIGGLIGSIGGNIAVAHLGLNQSLFNNFIILAMAGYFAAIVRAPFTGVILLLEMTGSFVDLLPLALVAILAGTVADLLESAPIYESLLKSQMSTMKIESSESDDSKKITLETVVHEGAPLSNKLVRDIEFPRGSAAHCHPTRRPGTDTKRRYAHPAVRSSGIPRESRG